MTRQLKRSWVCVPHFLAIHPIAVETFFTKNQKCQPHGGSKGEAILSSWNKAVQTSLPIHHTKAEIFPSGPNWWNSWPTLPSLEICHKCTVEILYCGAIIQQQHSHKLFSPFSLIKATCLTAKHIPTNLRCCCTPAYSHNPTGTAWHVWVSFINLHAVCRFGELCEEIMFNKWVLF